MKKEKSEKEREWEYKEILTQVAVYEQAHRRSVGTRCPECHRAVPEGFCMMDKYKQAKRDIQLAILDIIKELEKFSTKIIREGSVKVYNGA